MSRTQLPRVTMGMPLYNGEPYLERTLDSLLGQTFEDFELLVSDNASTDRTADICRAYASRDPRLRYLRNDVNIGFCRNQNRVIELAQGEYFLLTHHDDLRSPEYLARTIDALDADPSLTVCYTQTLDIDATGRPLPRRDPPLRLDHPDVRMRFRDVIRMDHLCEADFGLTRMRALRRTQLHGAYADSDRVLLAELLFQGPFRKLPEELFFRRAHALQSTAINQDRQTRSAWFDPARNRGFVFPHFRQLRDYLAAIERADMDIADKLWCYGEMTRWIGANRVRLLQDLDYAFKKTFRPAYHLLTARTK